MRLYKGYKKHYQYQTLVNLLLLLFLFVILAFVIKNYFKPFFIIIVLLIISNPMYDLIKKIIQKKEIAGALTILLINVLMFCFIFYFGNSIVGLIQSLMIPEDTFSRFLLVFASMLIVGVCAVYRLLSVGERAVLQGYIQRVYTKFKK